MRQKFSAWDYKTETMRKVKQLDLDGFVVYEGTPDDYWQAEFALREYTGLKDKNGVDVYEGDIAKYSHYPDSVVVFDYDEEILSHKATVISEGIYCEDHIFISTDSRRFEIIGNIYENPELLT